MPPVSIRIMDPSFHGIVAVILSRVVPGESETMALECPTNLLNKVDFPTLGLPTIATKGLVMCIPH